MTKKKYLWMPVIALIFAGCGLTTSGRFEEISTADSGLNFSNDLTENENFNLIDYLYFYNGGGVAVGDINNDGLDDIYFSANQKPNKLYLNKGNFKFEDITEKAGVAAPGDWKTGVTMVDINADGLLDIYVCQLGDYKGIEGKNQFYINNGDMTFTDRAEEYGLDFKGFSTHAAFFDYDNDHDLDVYLLNHSVHTSRSYGKSDLRYEVDSLAGDRLYRNDGGSFTDVTAEAGIYSSHIGYGLAVGLSDVDMDGFTDIYISNDFHENDYLYLNNGDGTFTESIRARIDHTSRSSMGNDIADYNNDGWPDIISLDMLPDDEVVVKMSAGEDPYDIYQLKLGFGYQKQFARNALQLNLGGGKFSEQGILAGVHATDWSWAPLLADFDNDGLKDLFISNGIVRRPNDMDYINFISNESIPNGPANNPDMKDAEIAAMMPEGSVVNYLFRNNGDLTFEDVSTEWGLSNKTFSNGSAYADFDNDGDLDLVVNNINGPATLMKNNTVESSDEQSGNFLKVKLNGTGANPNGIGAKLLAYANDQEILQEAFVTRGYQSSVSHDITLGVGDAASLDSLRVVWPGGASQLLTNVATNQSLTLAEADANDIFVLKSERLTPLLIPDTVSGPDFRHEENLFVDYNREYMIPHISSEEGPKMATADVNKDGLEDLYIGGATYNEGVLCLQTADGRFVKSDQPAFTEELAYEELGVNFFDANGDGFQDLYVVSAGNEFEFPHPMTLDRLFMNDGNGNFALAPEALPKVYQHGSVVTDNDFDHDGDLDIFIGGQVVPGQYGVVPISVILQNDGSGKFTNVTDSLAPGLKHSGMVKDALWTDINADGWDDLMVVGEWMPIKVFINREGRLVNEPIIGLEKSYGWWNNLEPADIDGDGDLDYIAGNLGLNSKLQADMSNPVRMYINDFDVNGKIDPIISYMDKGKEYPVATKDELVKQMPIIRKNYVRHIDYAGRSVQEIFSEQGIKGSNIFAASIFASSIIENLGNGQFEIRPLPLAAQLAPIAAMAIYDLNGDGHLDIISGGNREGVSPYYGTYDASKGLVMLGDGTGNFRALWPEESGILIDGEIRDIKVVETAAGPMIIFARNDDTSLSYRLAE